MSNILRIYTSHTIKTVSLSLIGVYVPIYLLTLGYSLSSVIIFFIISHGFALIFGLFLVVPLLKRYGPITVLKISFPLHILFLTLLLLFPEMGTPLYLIALLSGASSIAYWIPLNLLFIKHSEKEDMGNNLGKFFALPKFFGIFGPLLSAALIPFFGFVPVFILTVIGIGISYIPLLKVDDKRVKVTLNFSKAWQRLKRNKTLFFLEGFDNIIEESEWFWGIYVYLLIGSLATPGIVGSLEALGGAIFTVLVGKYANKKAKFFIPVAALMIISIMFSRIFISEPITAYTITVLASFVMTLFLVSYFSVIYKTVKGEGEEEFIILREIPTILGRMVVFGGILLTLSNQNLFFIVPIIFTILLLLIYYLKKKLFIH